LKRDDAAVYDDLGAVGFCNRSREGSFIFRSEVQSLGVVGLITATLTSSSKAFHRLRSFRRQLHQIFKTLLSDRNISSR